jgi:hypothetical protein
LDASIARRLAEVTQHEPAERVALLAAWDTYLMGYRSRELAVESAYAGRVVVSGGVIAPTAIVDGRAVAVWRAQQRRRQLTVALDPLEPLPARVREGVEQEAHHVARFLGADEAILTGREGGTRSAAPPGPDG